MYLQRDIRFAVAGLVFLGFSLIVPHGYIQGCIWGVGVGLCAPNWVGFLARWFGPEEISR